ALALRDRQQRGIELDERRVHGGMRGVATVTVHARWDHLGGFRIAENEEGPLPWKARLVLYVHLQPHDFGALIVAVLVDRAFAFAHAPFEDECRFVGPGSRLDECL